MHGVEGEADLAWLDTSYIRALLQGCLGLMQLEFCDLKQDLYVSIGFTSSRCQQGNERISQQFENYPFPDLTDNVD